MQALYQSDLFAIRVLKRYPMQPAL